MSRVSVVKLPRVYDSGSEVGRKRMPYLIIKPSTGASKILSKIKRPSGMCLRTIIGKRFGG